MLPYSEGINRLYPWLLAAIVLAAVAWIYWPGSSGPLLLDDRSSLDDLSKLDGNPQLAWDVIFGDVSGLFGRSVSMATFVAERLLLDQGMVGSKRVNIAIHVFNGALVMWLMALVFRFLEVTSYRCLAVLLGAIWLLHPLFVSSVLYAVQRMTLLATLFMLLALVSYMYWRFALLEGRFSPWRFSLVPLFILTGLLAKENSIVVIPVILLLEVLLFECRDRYGSAIPWLRTVSFGLIGLGAVGSAIALVMTFGALTKSYEYRYFSLFERLLTQTRILWDYVAQFVVPDVSRMGLYHDDVVVSVSLQQPPQTLYAVLAWAGVLAVCAVFLKWRWGRLCVLGVAWFLLAHGVESTVIPLELYFEHRNYFPSIGLLLFLGFLYAGLVSIWKESGHPALAWLALIPLVLSAQTSSQVQIWSSRPLLVLNHINSSPESSRANIDMAEQLALMGEVEEALYYSERAYVTSFVERPGDWAIRDLALACLAGAEVSRELVEKVGVEDAHRPLSSVGTLIALVRLLQDNHCPSFDREYFADHLATIYLSEEFRARGSSNIYSSLAVLENALGRYDKALAYVEQFLAIRPGNSRGLLMKLHFATALGNAAEAEDARSTLLALDAQGRLTSGEQETLALYGKP